MNSLVKALTRILFSFGIGGLLFLRFWNLVQEDPLNGTEILQEFWPWCLAFFLCLLAGFFISDKYRRLLENEEKNP